LFTAIFIAFPVRRVNNGPASRKNPFDHKNFTQKQPYFSWSILSLIISGFLDQKIKSLHELTFQKNGGPLLSCAKGLFIIP